MAVAAPPADQLEVAERSAALAQPVQPPSESEEAQPREV